MSKSAYFHHPSIAGEKIVFVAEDDLWLVDSRKVAIRLTSSPGIATAPLLSPDEKSVAYISNESGDFDLYVINLDSGASTRLTYWGGISAPVKWLGESDSLAFRAFTKLPPRHQGLYKIPLSGGIPEELPYRNFLTLDFGENQEIVLGRYQITNARWKRYRGGTAGQILVSKDSESFSILDLPDGNPVNPMVIGDRIYFLDDHERIGNLYSCDMDGKDLQKHTNSDDYYFVFAQTDGRRIIMQKAGDLYIYDTASQTLSEVEFSFISAREMTKPRLMQVGKYFADVDINPNSSHAVLTSRGKAFYFGLFEESYQQIGKPQGVKYTNPLFLDDERIALISDEENVPHLEIYTVNEFSTPEETQKLDIGVIRIVKQDPKGKFLAIGNNRQQIFTLDLSSKQLKEIHVQRKHGRSNFDFSKDGKWLVFTVIEEFTSKIALYDLEKHTLHEITGIEFADREAIFDAKSERIFFISNRHLNPSFDSQMFQYNFSASEHVYSIPLLNLTESLVNKPAQPFNKNNNQNGKKEDKKEEQEKKEEAQEEVVEVDLDGIQSRIEKLPIPADWVNYLGAVDNRLLYLTRTQTGMTPEKPNPHPYVLKGVNLKTMEVENVISGIDGFYLSPDRNVILVQQGEKLRVLKPDVKESDLPKEEIPGPKTGWIDLSRIKLEIHPIAEWQQMVKETWRLMQEHYWDEQMGGIDWPSILEKYLVLVPKIGSRAELSELLWEMQGETGTSHSYEFGGDYVQPPNWKPAFLVADYKFNEGKQGFEITHIPEVDVHDDANGSPLLRPGVRVAPGDVIVQVNGQPVSSRKPLEAFLMGQAGKPVQLKIWDKSEDKFRVLHVKPQATEQLSRYRAWVDTNRALVHQRFEGKVGYIHIPNMAAWGMNEFVRTYPMESERDALIVDVRFNGGGHTSQLVLEKLARKLLGYDEIRYGKEFRYPSYTRPGPIIAITNAEAGSDGDIFSHSFKMLNLGTLIGTRTWGGVIGINGQYGLVDGTRVTQPEYSFYFNDVGYDVENYGTDPDIEVDFLPQDFAKGVDPQLEHAMALMEQKIKENPISYPDLSKKPKKL